MWKLATYMKKTKIYIKQIPKVTKMRKYCKYFNKINQYEDKGSFEGWMKRIVINTTLQKHRKEKYFEIINENLLEDPEIEVDDEEITTDFLLESIQDLPERYRQIFNLYALDGFSHKEIAEMLNISMGSSKSNLARARHILKSKIENHLNDNKVQSL